MKRNITTPLLNRYFSLTGEALQQASIAFNPLHQTSAKECWEMAKRYYDDAHYFTQQNEFVRAFAALNYAHGWLDAGAHLRLFLVHDSRLFTVDDKDKKLTP